MEAVFKIDNKCVELFTENLECFFAKIISKEVLGDLHIFKVIFKDMFELEDFKDFQSSQC